MARVELTREEREASTPEAKAIAIDAMLRRFKKMVINQGILEDWKKHEFFMKKSLRRKEKSKKARILLIREKKLKGRKQK